MGRKIAKLQFIGFIAMHVCSNLFLAVVPIVTWLVRYPYLKKVPVSVKLPVSVMFLARLRKTVLAKRSLLRTNLSFQHPKINLKS